MSGKKGNAADESDGAGGPIYELYPFTAVVGVTGRCNAQASGVGGNTGIRASELHRVRWRIQQDP
jgi:hypothetical protein